MMIATIILIALMLINFGINIAKHGEDKHQKYNWWSTLIAMIINIVLLYFAGVFNNFK